MGRQAVAALLLLGAACLQSPPDDSSPPPVPDGGSTSDGGFAGCTGQPVSELVDDFADPELPGWTAFSTDAASCAVRWISGDVEITNDGGAADQCGLRSTDGYDLTGGATWLAIDSDADPTGDPGIEYRVYVTPDRYVVIQLGPNGLRAGRCAAGSGCALATPEEGQLRYWRIGHDASRRIISADASSNFSNWTLLAEVAESEVGCVHLELGSYANPAGENAPVLLEGVDVE